MVGLILTLLFVAIVVFIIRSSVKLNKRMKQRAKELGAYAKFFGIHVEGLPADDKTAASLFACSDRLVIDCASNSFEIFNDKIMIVKAMSETEVLEANKSVIGRAVVGGLLLGGLGAIVGGISGVGTKRKKGKTNNYLIINYLNKDNEPNVISFKNNLNIIALHKFVNMVNHNTIVLNKTANGTVQL